MIKAALVLQRLRESGKKVPPSHLSKPLKCRSHQRLGWLVCTGVTSQRDIFFQIPSSLWKWLPLYFADDSASATAFQITLYFCCLPESHVLTSCIWFQRGADWLDAEDPTAVGVNPFCPLHFRTEQDHLPAESPEARCPFALQIRKGRGSCGNPERAALRVWWALFWFLPPRLLIFVGNPPVLATCVTVRCCWQLSQRGLGWFGEPLRFSKIEMQSINMCMVKNVLQAKLENLNR